MRRSLVLVLALVAPVLAAPDEEEPLARLGTTRFRHEHAVTSVAVSPDGKTIAAASFDGTVKLWDPATGQERGRLTASGRFVAFAPDGKHLVTSRKNTVLLWDMKGEPRVFPGGRERIDGAALSPSGKELVAVGDEPVARFIDVESAKEIAKVELAGRGERVAFSQDGKWVAVGCQARDPADYSGRIVVIDVAKRAIAWENKRASVVHGVAFSPDGTRVAEACQDKTVRCSETATGKLVFVSEELTRSGQSVAFSPDGRTIAACGFQTPHVALLDAATGVASRKIPFEGSALAVMFAPDGATLVVGGARNVRLFEVSSGKALGLEPGHRDRVQAMVSRGSVLATASEDGQVSLWNADSGELRHAFFPGEREVIALALSPDGKWLAVGDDAGPIHLYETATGTRAAKLDGHKRKVTGLAFSPDGERLASTGFDDRVRLWNVAKRSEARPAGKLETPLAVAWSPDSKSLALACLGKTASICSRDFEWRHVLGGHDERVDGIAWAPDGKLVATAGDKELLLQDPETGQVVRKLVGHEGSISAVVFSPDGKRLLTAAEDGTARIWDVATGKELKKVTGLGDYGPAAAFVREGKAFAISRVDTTVTLHATD